MATDDAWTVELIEDRGHRGSPRPDFVTGPRFLVRRPETDEEGVVELMLGRVYVRAIRDAAGDASDRVVLDLLDEVGADIVRHDLPQLQLETPPRVTPLYVDGEGVDRLVKRAAERG